MLTLGLALVLGGLVTIGLAVRTAGRLSSPARWDTPSSLAPHDTL